MNIRLILALLAVAAMPACADTPTVEASAKPAAPHGQALTAQILYQFLLGELAGQRGDLNLSAEAYADLAIKTRDARIARRATEIALYARQTRLALQDARLWQELDPKSPKALHALSSLLIGAGKLTEAKTYLLAWLKTGNQEETFQLLPGLVARQADHRGVLDLVIDLAAAYPALPAARLAVAQVAMQAGQERPALEAVDQALGLKAGWEKAALLKARIVRQQKGEAAALAYLAEFIGAYPEARDVRLSYARQLASANRMVEARTEFDRLARELPDNPEVRFMAGLAAMQANDFDAARASLTKALDLGHPDESGVRFALGQMAEGRGLLDEALTWFKSIERGRQSWEAKQHVALVLARQGKLQEARDWLAQLSPSDEGEQVQRVQTEAQILREAKDLEGGYSLFTKALETYPDNPDLLYDRAMTSERLNRIDAMEKDLRHLIKLRPDHAHAYNALGYTLADRTNRVAEAIELIEKAIKLAPDDPFIQDSMGWALFKAKRYGEAVPYLRRAFEARPDPDIAAHLGEALWVKGDRDEARAIWQGSLKDNPENESLRETVSRLTR